MTDQLVGADRVRALLNPRNVAIVGASDKPGSWAQRVWRNLERYGFPGAVFPINPGRDAIWGVRCYRRFADLPEPPDHLVVLVPAAHVCAALREGAAAGARSATVMSSGFGESPDEKSQALAADLAATIAETGLAVSGPNCLGNFNVAARLFTMTDDRPHGFARGPVALFGQSGGIVMAIKRTLEERGVNTDALITSGNEAGLTAADYIRYFSGEAQIRVIVGYLESVRDRDAFLDACRSARAAGKAVIVVKLGASQAGRAAAAAHTGALAGSLEAFDAVAGAAGALRARNLDEAVELVEFLAHAPRPRGGRLGSITFSGGMRGLLLDAASETRLVYEPLSEHTKATLDAILSVGSIVGNPLDAGFTALTSGEAYLACVKAMAADPRIDALLLQEEIPRAPGSERKERNLRAVNALAAESDKPIAFVSMISYGLTDYARALRAELPHLVFLQEVERGMRALDALVRHAEGAVLAPTPIAPPSSAERAALAELDDAPEGTLDEIASKKLLRAFGLTTPREGLARGEEEAVAMARVFGYPLVAKIVSTALPHKSDIGGVRVGIVDETGLREAYRAVRAAAASAAPDAPIGGVLIAEMKRSGIELILGLHRDPEMGAVVLFGVGGVDLELFPDSAVAAPPLDERRARDLIARTRVGRLIRGYRGRPPLDEAPLVAALVNLSRLAVEAGDRIESVDVNPFLLTEKEGVALDALVVKRRSL